MTIGTFYNEIFYGKYFSTVVSLMCYFNNKKLLLEVCYFVPWLGVAA